ncbi:hypothetical protein HDU97_003539, partial [Phlyctochytrium planicorne]
MPQNSASVGDVANPPFHPVWRDDLDKFSVSARAPMDGPNPASTDDKTRAICHGRVDNLEAMVPPQWWKALFGDGMYLKTDGDVVEDPEVTQAEIAMLEKDNDVKVILQQGSGVGDGTIPTERPARILDLCCGQGRHSLFLAKEYPYLSVHGHDQSSYLISLAQERASFSNLSANVTFTVGDCRQIPYPDRYFDLVVLMGNSFGYFTDDNEDRVVMNEVFRVLCPGGKVILDLTDGGYMRENFSTRSWEWIDDKTFVCRERQLSKDGLRLSSREVINSTTKGVVRDQFYQERLYTREEVERMLFESNFEIYSGASDESLNGITIAKDLSKRQEDLGMMEHRMLVKAGKPTQNIAAPDPNQSVLASTTKAFSPSPNLRAAKRYFEKFVVVLGDPLQSCVGKLNNKWNEEDFETRRRLIEALNELGYGAADTIIVDNHDKLIDSLRTYARSSFVFNLCDEGFNNDAVKELHVPALLEMLNIPFSGAGPNCLSYCYDKGIVNRSAESLGIATPKELTFLLDVATPAIESVDNLHKLIGEKIGYPAFIKPMKGDNSLGITGRSIVRSQADVDSYIGELASVGIREVVIQEYLQGKEYSVGMVGNLASGFHFFPVLEVDYSKIIARKLPPILGFESKWDPKSPYWTEIS